MGVISPNRGIPSHPYGQGGLGGLGRVPLDFKLGLSGPGYIGCGKEMQGPYGWGWGAGAVTGAGQAAAAWLAYGGGQYGAKGWMSTWAWGGGSSSTTMYPGKA